MRFFALQTDIDVLRKQFIPEGEHEIMIVARHPLKFAIDFIWKTLVALILGTLLATAIAFITIPVIVYILYGFFALVWLWYVYEIISSYIAWRFNFLIVTSDKIVAILYHSFIHQYVHSVHLENIVRSKFETQFFGLFKCGVVDIHLDERLHGSAKVITMPYVPSPGTVSSAIENAIALKQQMAKGNQSPKKEVEKVEAIKENLQEQLKPASPDDPKVAPKEQSPGGMP